MKIQHVGTEWIPRVWHTVAPFLADALQYAGGDYTLDHAQALTTSGQWLLVVAVDDENTVRGAATLHIYNRPTDRVAFITAMGGCGIINRATLVQLKLLAASFGATSLEAAGRSTVVRLLTRLGFAEKYVTVGVKL